jgi:hypothetical protein
MPLDVDHRDQLAVARTDRAPGARRHDYDPGRTVGCHHAMLAAACGPGKFSDKPTSTGWDSARMARAQVELMKRLG